MRYKAVFHVDHKDEQILQLALNNVTNLLNAIPGQEYDLVAWPCSRISGVDR